MVELVWLLEFVVLNVYFGLLLVGFRCALFGFECCSLVWLDFNSVVLNLLGLLLLVYLWLVCL